VNLEDDEESGGEGRQPHVRASPVQLLGNAKFEQTRANVTD